VAAVVPASTLRAATQTSWPSESKRRAVSNPRPLLENTVVTELLTDLRGRGLDTTRPALVAIAGDMTLRAGIAAVFDHPVVQRCQVHKLRNVADKLPDDLARAVTKQMRAAYHAPSVAIA